MSRIVTQELDDSPIKLKPGDCEGGAYGSGNRPAGRCECNKAIHLQYLALAKRAGSHGTL